MDTLLFLQPSPLVLIHHAAQYYMFVFTLTDLHIFRLKNVLRYQVLVRNIHFRKSTGSNMAAMR